MTEPRIGLVVSTIGRVEPLKRLLDSVIPQLGEHDSVVVVSQGAEQDCAALARSLDRETSATVTCITSAKGLSVGRNAGAVALGDRVDVLMFPNDRSVYPDGLLARVRKSMKKADIVSAAVKSDGGFRVRPLEPGARLTAYSAWDVHEAGLAIRSDLFARLEGFDPLLGVGAPTPFQAAEGADLLLRALKLDRVLVFEALPRELSVRNSPFGYGLSDAERRRKARAYARGVGRVLAMHGPSRRVFRSLAGAASSFVRQREVTLVDSLAVLTGRIEGLAWGAASDLCSGVRTLWARRRP
ncbi:glycosyltransferase family 2 protein [Demequina capsici]|uniref:Glycosyl transferase family 2 n=1 Tax=Demequina capsici TaxID=3075620 RepID=A0AA96F8V5_9MICO|nr:hypothetical protein [Demequina sp. OYTSA14]WNM24902.1 hypothetical protein RN606_01760 [Demequina sp. OYTSA14]